MTDFPHWDDNENEELTKCRNCGGENISEIEGTAVLVGGKEYFVMCFDCYAASEPSYDFGIEADAEECRFMARSFWNAHGWSTYRPGVAGLFE